MTETKNQEKPTLTHLHVHTEYSLIDGASKISDLIEAVKAMGHNALAITDHSNMFGAIEHYTKCKSAGIKPILGCEIFHEGSAETHAAASLRDQIPKPEAFRLVTIAQSNKGYKSLCRVVSFGYLHSDFSRPVPIVNESDLDSETEGLIVLSGCLKGEFPYLVSLLATFSDDVCSILTNPPCETSAEIVSALKKHVNRMVKRYGKDNYYVELTNNNLPDQIRLLPQIANAGKWFNLPLVAAADSHYTNDDFIDAHAVLIGIKNDLTMSKLRRRRKNTRFHLPSNEEMLATFAQWPEAITNTNKIANSCDVEIKFGIYYLPQFELEGTEDINSALRRLSYEGLEDRYEQLEPLYGDWLSAEKKEEYTKRLDYELDIIINMEFPGYFLIVQDFINWAKDQDIPVGPGRGSGAGSLVAYALKITDIDPIPLSLIFERFLNPERISMPDFDVDFCQFRRHEVIQYVTRKYGEECTSMITTFGKMKAKAALRDVGRVLELGYTKVDRIAKLVPNELEITLTDALEKEPRILEEASKDESIDEMIKIARQLEGLSRHTSVHAAGVVVTDGPMENYVPVYRAEEGGPLITMYEMKNAEKVGLVKFDFLGLKTLTVVHKAVQIIRKSLDPDFNIDTIDRESKPVYREISTGQTCGIFQLESTGMQALVSKLMPSCFEDIVAVVALFRPGPLGSGMVDDFIERKHGRQQIEYSHPDLEPILSETYGIILYQEQVQKIAANLANYSLGEADLLRRAMGKKIASEMAKQKTRFLEGTTENKIDHKLADDLFELMAKFAAYGFNKSHSAAYGLVSYQTAFLKTFYPAEFMAAIMTCDLDNSEKLTRYIEECKRLRFEVLPPDINRSELEFDVPRPKTVGFGLSAIKGIGAASLTLITEERHKSGPFKSLTELARRINLHKVGKKTLELLVQAGALDSFNLKREDLFSKIIDMVKFSENHHAAKSLGQVSLFGEEEEEESIGIENWEKTSTSVKSKRSPVDWLIQEKKLLCVFVSGHPLDYYPKDVKRFSKIKLNEIQKNIGSKNLPVVCFLNDFSERLTKSGKRMAYVNLEDSHGSWEAVMFQNEIPENIPTLNTIVIAWISIGKSFDGTSINVRVEKLKPLEDVRSEMIKRAWIDIKAEKNPAPAELESKKELLSKVNNLIKENPGNTQIKIRLKYPEAEVLLSPQNQTINLSEQMLGQFSQLTDSGVQLSY